jgi:ABC-type transporter Mla maintaining outer membrane lipid asymmetry permease subunit MlaE
MCCGKPVMRLAPSVPGLLAMWNRVSGLSSLGVAVIWHGCKPLTWRRTVQAECWRHGAQVMLQGLMPIVITGFLVGIGMVFQVLYWLQLVGQEDVIGDFLVLVLVREIAPILVALIVIGRSGAVMITELGVMRAGGQAHLLDAQGLDLLHFLVVPRVVATALGVFCLCQPGRRDVTSNRNRRVALHRWGRHREISLITPRPQEYVNRVTFDSFTLTLRARHSSG